MRLRPAARGRVLKKERRQPNCQYASRRMRNVATTKKNHRVFIHKALATKKISLF